MVMNSRRAQRVQVRRDGTVVDLALVTALIANSAFAERRNRHAVRIAQAVIRFFGRVTEETTSRFNDEFDFLENIIRPSCIRVDQLGGRQCPLRHVHLFTIANATVDADIIEGIMASMASIWAAGKRSLMREDYAI